MIDKTEAKQRLDAIEREAQELRRIIEGPEVVFDERKLYVGLKDGCPYISRFTHSRTHGKGLSSS